MFGSIVLIPAYGKQYTSKEQALTDWKAGEDFRMVGFGYTSIRDIKELQAQLCSVYISLRNLSATITVSNH